MNPNPPGGIGSMVATNTAPAIIAPAGRVLIARDPHETLRLINAADRIADRLTPDFDGNMVHDRITAANASLFRESFFSEPLTTFAVGFRDTNNIEDTLQFFAPRVGVPNRFEYAEMMNAEEFYMDGDDDLRALGADFKTVEYTEKKTQAKTDNRGLQIIVDLDQVTGDAWRKEKTAKLIRRLRRNSLRRTLLLLSAAAINTAKTWDTSAGKDPDMDVIAELVLGTTASGVAPNRVGYGHTAWQKRALAHRAQTAAGGFASASLSPEALAGLLAVDRVYCSKERFQSGATKAEIVGALVLMFMALDNADTEDPSNIKRFVSPTATGGDLRVYEQEVGPKLFRIAVEHYEKIAITSTLGIRQFTIS